jgi:hypothetical protein
MRTGWLWATTLIVACSAPGVRIDENTEEGHKAEAAKERQEAVAEQAKYDPKAETVREVGPSGPAGTEGGAGVLITVNPTATHLAEAEAHRKHAKEHEAAAVALEKFQDQACTTVPVADRVSCPMLYSDVRTTLPNGVRLYTGSTRLPEVLASIRCQLAFARAHGYTDPSLCPFAQKGVVATPSEDRSGIDLTTPDADAVRALHSLVSQPLHGL